MQHVAHAARTREGNDKLERISKQILNANPNGRFRSATASGYRGSNRPVRGLDRCATSAKIAFPSSDTRPLPRHSDPQAASRPSTTELVNGRMGCDGSSRTLLTRPMAGDEHFRTFRNLNLMAEDDRIDEISLIEARLEELTEVAERCRKIIFVSKAAIAIGSAVLLVMMLGVFPSNQVAALGSIAAVLGAIVSLGSNVGTLRQTMAAMSAAELLRSEMIDRIELRVVGDRL